MKVCAIDLRWEMSLAGEVLAGRNNAGDDIAIVVPLSRRRWWNGKSKIEPGSEGNRFRLFLLLHFGGGGMEEETIVVVERRRRRMCRPHGAIQPLRHLFPHHFLLMDRSIDWDWINFRSNRSSMFLFPSSLRKKRNKREANKQVFHKFNI